MHESNSVIDSIQLIPLGPSDLSPMLEKVKIKVFYLGVNRNRSYIDRPTALEMSKTLRGCPIVGRYRAEKEDFTDHGEEVVINDKGITTECKTVPYGFVDLNAQIWFEDYIDVDEFGNSVQRTYLVTEGVVWAEQYPEIKAALREGGRPHSMELDNKTLDGHWADNVKDNIEIFIINDAVFSKLCILGDDTEPCFEGSSITPESNFNLEDNNFKSNLLSMIKEFKQLTFSLQEQGGNKSMNNELNDVQSAATVETEETPAIVETNENFSTESDKNEQVESVENQNNVEEFAKNSDDDKKDDDKEDSNEEDKSSDDDKKDDDDDDKKPSTKNELEEKYQLLESQYNELKDKYTSLEQQNAELVSFKKNVEDKEKDALIAQFYMLSDEDKKDVIENKSNYSLDEIEKELSVICVRKKVNFTSSDSENKEDPAITFNLNSVEVDNLPAWLKAVENHSNKNN